MFFLATADRHGECDNSFRAGPPGFLHVIDERTLVYPEYRGNGVHASLGNIQENPHLGILLVDFFQARIGLHVNGRAEVVEDAELRSVHPDLPSDSVPGRRALVWVRVTVEEAYIHCAKHIPHLQRAPKGTPRDWGTDDQRRKGGDFFGVAEEARLARRARRTAVARARSHGRAGRARAALRRPGGLARPRRAAARQGPAAPGGGRTDAVPRLVRLSGLPGRPPRRPRPGRPGRSCGRQPRSGASRARTPSMLASR
ncbi:pyridoxamine 5'-phosphate oxidase family protein [Streptomyces radiopugnans]|nr:pyridoxamine 5'-phosphate oxidase family protein [Streptomyces radiopugnans]